MGANWFNASTRKIDTRTPEAEQADEFLAGLLGRADPNIPSEKIAGMSDAEKLAQQIAQGYGESQPEGLDAIRSLIEQDTGDITKDPTFASILDVLDKRGARETNRTARGLMTRGVTGGVGRDALGRSVTDVNNNILATLAPYVEARKNRAFSGAQALNNLGESSVLNRLNALSTVGSLPRQLEQLNNSAQYQALMQQILFPYTTKASVASGISRQPMTLEQSPSEFAQYGQAGAAIINSLITGNPGSGGKLTTAGGGAGGLGGGGTQFGGVQSASAMGGYA